MNELIEKDDINIENMIYEINGIQVMIDSDLARIYKCKNGTKEINQAVKNNLNKFPERFSWVLSDEDWINLRSNFLTSRLNNNYGGRRYNPRVFTEHDVYMLSTVLKTKSAVETSLAIMDAFVKMRHFIKNNDNLYESISNINNKLTIHDEKLDYLFSKFDKKERLILKGQLYEAYSSILDILNEANDEIIVVDNYADKLFLDLIKNIKKSFILITKNSDRLNNSLINKYNDEYNNLRVIRDNSFHDRLIVIDSKEIYLLGSSVNSLGNKTTLIIKLEDLETINMLLNRINIVINKM